MGSAPRPSTNTYTLSNKAVLRRPLEPGEDPPIRSLPPAPSGKESESGYLSRGYRAHRPTVRWCGAQSVTARDGGGGFVVHRSPRRGLLQPLFRSVCALSCLREAIGSGRPGDHWRLPPIAIPIPASAIPPRARGAIRNQTLLGRPPDSSRVSTIQVEKVVKLPRRPVPSTSPASGWSCPVSMRAKTSPSVKAPTRLTAAVPVPRRKRSASQAVTSHRMHAPIPPARAMPTITTPCSVCGRWWLPTGRRARCRRHRAPRRPGSGRRRWLWLRPRRWRRS